MKRIVVIVLCILAIIFFLVFFYKKTFIQHELIFVIPGSRAEFAPNAYVFFHSDKELKNFIATNNETREMGIHLTDVHFDFTKYSYCIFYGKKIISMCYSPKQIYFDDPTPSYARTKGKIPVFIEYERGSADTKGAFIYRVPKNEKLRGFYD